MSTVVSSKKRGTQPNRRKTKRRCIYTRYPVLVHTLTSWKEGGRPSIGILTDIGDEGLGIIMDSSITSGTKVLVILHPMTQHERQLSGRVIWINPLPSANRIIKDGEGSTSFFRVGVRMANDDEEQNAFITKLISEIRNSDD
ncbi:MAG: PilZ domain-containing protein [Deltaproteobacteria bacterium]|nr:PilZ domain-containing protein [Deltaproteobacteria bacterium]